MELSWMPGPTDEARVLQLKQCDLATAWYSALSDLLAEFGHNSDYEINIFDEAAKNPRCLAAKAAYEASVAELTALLGADAHCNEVDCDLWSSYSDCYKSEYNIRPHFHVTATQARAYLMDNSISPATAI